MGYCVCFSTSYTNYTPFIFTPSSIDEIKWMEGGKSEPLNDLDRRVRDLFFSTFRTAGMGWDDTRETPLTFPERAFQNSISSLMGTTPCILNGELIYRDAAFLFYGESAAIDAMEKHGTWLAALNVLNKHAQKPLTTFKNGDHCIFEGDLIYRDLAFLTYGENESIAVKESYDTWKAAFNALEDQTPSYSFTLIPPSIYAAGKKEKFEKKIWLVDKLVQFELIKKIPDTNIREGRLEQLAQRWLDEDNQERALEIIDELFLNTPAKEAFIVKAAESYIKKGDKEKAFISINKLNHSNESKGLFIIKLAESYLGENDRENAFTMITSIIGSNEQKEIFLVKLARSYLKENDRKRAIRVIAKILTDTKTKEAFVVQIADSYLNEGDKEGAYRTIRTISRYHYTGNSFIVKLAESCLREKNQEMALEVIEKLNCKTDEEYEFKRAFLCKIAQSYFDEKNQEGYLMIIEKIVRELATLEFFKNGVFKHYPWIYSDIWIYSELESSNLLKCFFVILN